MLNRWTSRRRNVPLRRRIENRVQTFVLTATKAIFWMRHGHGLLEAWSKAWRTL